MNNIQNIELFITELTTRDRDYRDRKGTTTISFFHDGENVLEDLFNRHSRPHKLYRTLFPKIQKLLNLKAPIKATWSQYAGCSCPCSPGFIVTNCSELGLYRKQIFVSITDSLQTELKFEFPVKESVVA